MPTTLYSKTPIKQVRDSVEIWSVKMQSALNKVATWIKKWSVKLRIYTHTHLGNKTPVFINGTQFPYTNTLGKTLDVKLQLKEHIKNNIKF